MIRREASFSDGKLLIIIDNIFICIIKAITIIHYFASFLMPLQQRYRSAAAVMNSYWIGSSLKYRIERGMQSVCSATTAMLS